MSVWENLVSNSKDIVGQAAGDTLKDYTERLQTTQAPPAAAVPTTDKSKWLKIGGIVLAALGLGWVLYAVTKKKK